MAVSPPTTCTQVSVVVPTRNQRNSLFATLQAIENLDPAPLELLVIDQSNPENRPASVKAVEDAARLAGWTYSIEQEGQQPAETGRIRLIQSTQKGASRARNTGARLAKAELVLFTDDDTLPDNKWLKETLRQFSSPQIWGVYGRILSYKEQGRFNGVDVTRISKEPKIFSHPVLPWYLGSGANMAFRRSILVELTGGMDEILSIGEKFKAFEDIDIGYRILIMGGKIAYSPDSIVYHNSQKTFPEQLRTEAGYGISVGAATYKYWKCGDKRAPLILIKWIWQMGVRRCGAGLLKWHNPKVVRLSLLQFWWPLVGILRAYGQPVDLQHWNFLSQ